MKIKISDLSKSIKGNKVLDNISMELESGNIYGLQGKNGSGKTMLMRAICGLIFPNSGKINIDGKILGKDISFPESVGVLIENPSFLSNFTAFENLKLLAAIKGKINDDEIKQSLIEVGLNPEDNKKYKKFSLGMKQRLGIACAIMEHPDLVILDEPFNALDQMGVELIKDTILKLKYEGALVILACHDREELEMLSDEIFVLTEGRVVEKSKK